MNIESIFIFFPPDRVSHGSDGVFQSVPLEKVLHSFRLQWKYSSLIRVYPDVPKQ